MSRFNSASRGERTLVSTQWPSLSSLDASDSREISESASLSFSFNGPVYIFLNSFSSCVAALHF